MTNASNIIGIGTDIIEIDRFRIAMHKYGQAFLDKLFSKREQEHCQAYAKPEVRLAARFASKEAVVKALGVGFGKHITFKDIEILNQESGRPVAILSDESKEYFKDPIIHLTISHSRDYATATALIVERS